MFTIGNKKVYDEGLRRWYEAGVKLFKKGRVYSPEYYPGGIAFHSVEEAKAFMADNKDYAGMSVYILLVPDNATEEHEELSAGKEYTAYTILCDCQIFPLYCNEGVLQKACNELYPYQHATAGSLAICGETAGNLVICGETAELPDLPKKPDSAGKEAPHDDLQKRNSG